MNRWLEQLLHVDPNSKEAQKMIKPLEKKIRSERKTRISTDSRQTVIHRLFQKKSVVKFKNKDNQNLISRCNQKHLDSY
jgi:hypothetical protein